MIFGGEITKLDFTSGLLWDFKEFGVHEKKIEQSVQNRLGHVCHVSNSKVVAEVSFYKSFYLM